MEKVENIAKYILFLDKNNDLFINKLITLYGRDCYEGNVKLYIEKMFNILKYAPLEDLIKIFHQDEEWRKKHNFYQKKNQLIDVDGQKENYKIMCADFIDMLNND